MANASPERTQLSPTSIKTPEVTFYGYLGRLQRALAPDSLQSNRNIDFLKMQVSHLLPGAERLNIPPDTVKEARRLVTFGR
jgi:hypothetical protein